MQQHLGWQLSPRPPHKPWHWFLPPSTYMVFFLGVVMRLIGAGLVQEYTSGTVWDGELNTVVFGAQYSTFPAG